MPTEPSTKPGTQQAPPKCFTVTEQPLALYRAGGGPWTKERGEVCFQLPPLLATPAANFCATSGPSSTSFQDPFFSGQKDTQTGYVIYGVQCKMDMQSLLFKNG